MTTTPFVDCLLASGRSVHPSNGVKKGPIEHLVTEADNNSTFDFLGIVIASSRHYYDVLLPRHIHLILAALIMTDFAPQMNLALRQIIESEHFSPDDFRRRKLSLSQGFCLLWQNPRTGEVPGRMVDEVLHVTAVAAVLLDLMVLEKIALQLEKESFITRVVFPASRRIIVKVIDRNRTGTYLDECLLNRILNWDKEDSVSEWMVKTLSLPSQVVYTVFKSLIKIGILEKEQTKFDPRYPTINPEPQQELYKEVQMIALQGQIPDSYMWSLLKLARTCDVLQASTAPILDHLFDYKDYQRAITNIDKLIITDESRTKPKERKYKRQTGNFDDLFDLDG